MNIPFFIAKRYLFSKKNRNAINVISGISVLVVAVSTAALVIVLSSINGFGKLIDDQITVFAADLKIEPKTGKTFSVNTEKFKQVKQLKQVKYFAETLEDNILLKYGEKQLICTVKGIPTDYEEAYNLDTAIVYGIFKTLGKSLNYAVIGNGISYNLGISVESGESISLWIPNRKSVNILNPGNSFNKINLVPSGIITLDVEFDMKYIFTDLNLVRNFTDRDSATVSSVEILVAKGNDIGLLKEKIQNILGNDYLVKDLYEQFDVYRVMKSERLAAFIIMLFIIFIASFSIIGSVTMLIIEKKDDIFTLLSLGSSIKMIRRLFFSEGWLITILGALIGIFLGGLISYAQLKFGIVTFPSDGNYIVQAYPIELKTTDFILSFFSVSIVGFFISLYPASKIKQGMTIKN